MSISLNKLNKPGMNTSFGTSKTGKTGVTAQATKNMANFSSAGSSSIFKLNAKHSSNWVPGVKVTPNQSKHNYQGVRQSLNSRGFTPSVGLSSLGGVQGTQQFQASNNIGAYQKGQMIGQLVNGTFGMLNKMGVFDGLKGTAKAGAGEVLDGIANGNTATNIDSSSFSGQLSGVSSFKQINTLESQVEAKKTNLDSDYKKLDPKDDLNSIKEGAKDGFELAGVTLDTDNLALSTLDSNDLEKSMETIDGDIDKFGNFKTNDLPAAKNKITTKSGQIKGEISAKEGQLSQLEANNKDGVNNAQIQQLKREIQELKEQQEQLKKAETAIGELETKCDSTIDELKTKKAEIKDIKKFEDQVKDKKYDLAKSQDKDLKKALDKLKKLDAEIKKASVDKNDNDYDKKDDKRGEKLQKLNAERTAVFGTMSTLITSLSAAGSEPIVNSKNQSYTISNLTAALNYKPEGAES